MAQIPSESVPPPKLDDAYIPGDLPDAPALGDPIELSPVEPSPPAPQLSEPPPPIASPSPATPPTVDNPPAPALDDRPSDYDELLGKLKEFVREEMSPQGSQKSTPSGLPPLPTFRQVFPPATAPRLAPALPSLSPPMVSPRPDPQAVVAPVAPKAPDLANESPETPDSPEAIQATAMTEGNDQARTLEKIEQQIEQLPDKIADLLVLG